MLVLGRKTGQEILIGEGEAEVSVIVLSVSKDGWVRLGIDAPDDVPIDRLEVREAKEAAAAKAERERQEKGREKEREEKKSDGENTARKAG